MKKPIGTYIFGSLLLIFSLLFLRQNINILRALKIPTTTPNLILNELPRQFTYFEYFFVFLLFLISICGIIGSIGLFLRKEWGRKTAIGVGCVILIIVTGFLVLAISALFAETTDKGLIVSMTLVTLLLFVIVLLLFGSMIFFLMRQKIKEQFLQKTKIVKTKKK